MALKKECHKNGISFLCSESGLEHLGDNLNCCSCDGLDEVEPNATEAMKKTNTFQPFKAIEQTMLEIGGDRIDWIREQKEVYNGNL